MQGQEGRGHIDEALKVNGFTKESIYDRGKQSAFDLILKFEGFCTTHSSGISKAALGQKRSGLSNTAEKLGMPPEQHPHIGINGAGLAVENTSVMLFGRHYYPEYERFSLPAPGSGASLRMQIVDARGAGLWHGDAHGAAH